MDLAALAAEFPRDAVHWRPQGTPYERNGTYSCMALAYIDARDVMDRLDEVCGPAGWQNELSETPKGRMICRIGIRDADGQWIWKGDGAGDTDVEGEKGGISDSLKRAAVAWGIGRYLYRLKSPWVACEVSNKSGKVYWKKWAVDPWTCVRGQPAAPQSQPKGKPKESDHAVTEAVGCFEKAGTLDAANAIWRDLPAALKADDRVKEAAKAAKARNTKEAA